MSKRRPFADIEDNIVSFNGEDLSASQICAMIEDFQCYLQAHTRNSNVLLQRLFGGAPGNSVAARLTPDLLSPFQEAINEWVERSNALAAMHVERQTRILAGEVEPPTDARTKLN